MLKEKNAGDKAKDAAGWMIDGGLAAMATGVPLLGSGATISATVFGAPVGIPVAAVGAVLEGLGFASAAGGTAWMDHISKYQNEVAKGMKYVTENGAEVLNKTAEDIATELGISTDTAELLKKNKDQLANYAETMSD
jgi:hypothetical protein